MTCCACASVQSFFRKLRSTLTRGDVGPGDVDAEHRLQVLLVGDHDVDIAHERAHDRLRLRFGPELLAEIQVDADPGARGAPGGAGLPGAFRAIGAERRGDAGHVKPVRALHRCRPVDRIRLHLGD